MLENVGKAIGVIDADSKDPLEAGSIGAEDVVDGNLKQILALGWRLIRRYHIRGAGKNELLEWVYSQIKDCHQIKSVRKVPYVAPLEDFASGFQDGLAFCGLIHAIDSSAVDWSRLDPTDAVANCQYAFDLAAQVLGIPTLLDAKAVGRLREDQHALMTYVSLFRTDFDELSRPASPVAAPEPVSEPDAAPMPPPADTAELDALRAQVAQLQADLAAAREANSQLAASRAAEAQRALDLAAAVEERDETISRLHAAMGSLEAQIGAKASLVHVTTQTERGETSDAATWTGDGAATSEPPKARVAAPVAPASPEPLRVQTARKAVEPAAAASEQEDLLRRMSPAARASLGLSPTSRGRRTISGQSSPPVDAVPTSPRPAGRPVESRRGTLSEGRSISALGLNNVSLAEVNGGADPEARVEENEVDVWMKGFLAQPENASVAEKLTPLGNGVYRYGARRVHIFVINDDAYVRVGGGFVTFKDYTERHAKGGDMDPNALLHLAVKHSALSVRAVTVDE